MSEPLLNRIKSVLADKNISSKTLAGKLDVSEQTVSGWCTNSKQPSLKTLYEIAKYLKIDIRDLLVSTQW